MDVLTQDLDAGILTLTLNRPEKLNALNADLLHALSDAFLDAKKRDEVKALMITGEDKAFCAGADINRLAECDAKRGYEFAIFGQSVFRQLETLGKPSLALVNGYAFGGGCELAMSATLRLAADGAQFGQPEVKLGVMPGYGGTQRLARLVGKGRALDLCLTGRFINAKTALDWGLVSAVYELDHLIKEGKQWLTTIINMAPLAIQGVMETIDHGYDLSLEDALHLEAIHFSALCASADKNEGVGAFLNKRSATFKGE